MCNIKSTFLFLLLLMSILSANAQDKYFTKTGKITFDATAKNSPENVDAINNAVTCVLDTKSGNIQLAVLMKGFQFERALMQEHFNENYVESDKYPRSEFKGRIENAETLQIQKEGIYDVTVKGKLTIHGVTRDVQSTGKIIFKNGTINTKTKFSVQLSDYNISIPQLVSDKLSPTVIIDLDCNLQPLKG